MKFYERKRFAAVVLAGVLTVAALPALADTADALAARAQAAEASGNFDEAVMLLQAAMVADPARISTYVQLGDFYTRKNEPAFARKYYDEALFLDPTLPVALAGSVRADLALGARESAAAKLARLEKVCVPDCAEAARLRAALDTGKKPAAAMPSASLDKH